METPVIDILLAQKFLPQHGGSIAWMFNVYTRWPRPVQVITHDYYNVALGTADFPNKAERPARQAPLADARGSGKAEQDKPVDHVTHPNLVMDRRDIFLRDWGLDRPWKWARYWRMMRAVSERLRGNRRATVRVHCIHAVPEAASLIPLKWRYGRRLKIISYAHGEEITACCTSWQLTFLMHRAHGACDRMIANSQNTSRLLTNHIDPAKVVVVHPGVDVPAFDGAGDAGLRLRNERGWRDRLMVLTLARMDARKNQAAVMRAVKELCAKHPSLVYVIAGGGQMKESLVKLAGELELGDRVVFPGEVDGGTKLGLYGACDVFAMPAIQVGSDVEGFGMVFLEAGACGKPCVAGSSGGQAEAVTDGQTGFVVDGTQQPAVTAALDRLLSDAALRQRMGQAGRLRALAQNWPRVVQRTVELVDSL